MRKLLLLVIGAPILGLALIAAAMVAELWTEANGAAYTLDLAYAGDIKAARKMVSCYRDGCRGVHKAPVLSCAWATVIVEEEAPSPKGSDLAAQQENCDRLDAEERRVVQNAVSDILEMIRIHKAHDPSSRPGLR